MRGDASLEGFACRTQKLEEEVKAAKEEMWGAQQTAAAATAKAEVLQRAVAQVGPCCCTPQVPKIGKSAIEALGWVAASSYLLTLPSGALVNEGRAMSSAPQLVHQVDEGAWRQVSAEVMCSSLWPFQYLKTLRAACHRSAPCMALLCTGRSCAVAPCVCTL